jgi:hypothetical protein
MKLAGEVLTLFSIVTETFRFALGEQNRVTIVKCMFPFITFHFSLRGRNKFRTIIARLSVKHFVVAPISEHPRFARVLSISRHPCDVLPRQEAKNELVSRVMLLSFAPPKCLVVRVFYFFYLSFWRPFKPKPERLLCWRGMRRSTRSGCVPAHHPKAT